MLHTISSAHGTPVIFSFLSCSLGISGNSASITKYVERRNPPNLLSVFHRRLPDCDGSVVALCNMNVQLESVSSQA